MGKKRLQRILLATGLVFMTGYAAHLGGCNTQKIKGYYNTIAKRYRQASDIAQEGYKEAEKGYDIAQKFVRDAQEYIGGQKDSEKPEENAEGDKKKASGKKVNV